MFGWPRGGSAEWTFTFTLLSPCSVDTAPRYAQLGIIHDQRKVREAGAAATTQLSGRIHRDLGRGQPRRCPVREGSSFHLRLHAQRRREAVPISGIYNAG